MREIGIPKEKKELSDEIKKQVAEYKKKGGKIKKVKMGLCSKPVKGYNESNL